MKYYHSVNNYRSANNARKHPKSSLHKLHYLQLPKHSILLPLLLRNQKRRRKNARHPLRLPSTLPHVPKPPPKRCLIMNIKISEKLITGLFIIWLAVVIFLTTQINTYKIENEKLKEYIKRNQYSEQNE